MTKEEQEAIKELKNRREYFEFQPEGCNWRLSFDQEEVNTIIDVVINLIDKQQKEIEELKEANEQQMLFTFKNNDLESVELVDNSFISKDKIRTFIREYLPDEEIMQTCQIYDTNGILIREKLQELLEEE